jgi:iron complex transport system substrate-binding protein
MLRRRGLLLGCLALAACRKKQAERSVPQRIVSISPSITEAVYAIGLGSRLVGRSRYCDYPPEVRSLPQVGGFVDPSFEAILALRPDLVVGARGPAGSAIADRLAARDIATYFPETESFAAIDAMILGLGERTGSADSARAAVDRVHGGISHVETAVAGLPRPKVLLVFGLAPLSVAGPSSFADEMIRRAGGVNVMTEGGSYPTIGVEHVLRLDPDVVVNAAMMEERHAERIGKGAPGWDHVRAIQNDRLASLTDESILRPGPRIGNGLAILARAVHPEAQL